MTDLSTFKAAYTSFKQTHPSMVFIAYSAVWVDLPGHRLLPFFRRSIWLELFVISTLEISHRNFPFLFFYIVRLVLPLSFQYTSNFDSSLAHLLKIVKVLTCYYRFNIPSQTLFKMVHFPFFGIYLMWGKPTEFIELGSILHNTHLTLFQA